MAAGKKPQIAPTIGQLAEQVVTDVVAKAAKVSKADKTATKPEANWTKIEADYRAGVKPLRLIGQEHGVSHTAIGKRAEKEGWARDLGAKVRAKADEKVSRAAVSTEVAMETKVAESVVIEAESQLQYSVRMRHRSDISRSRNLMANLMSELEQQTSNLEDFERLGELLDETDVGSRGQIIKDTLNQIYRKVISTPGRVDSAKKLIEMLEKVVSMERVAFGIDQSKDERTSVETLLERIAKKQGFTK